nr:hypothetical protein [Bacillus mycoides]
MLLPLTTVKLTHTPFSSYTANELFDGKATVIVFPAAACGIVNHFAYPFACSVTLDDWPASSGFTLRDCYMRYIQLKRSQLFNLYKAEKDVLLRIQKVLHYISTEYHQDPFVSTLFQEYKEYHSPEITACFKEYEEEAIKMISDLLEKGYQQGALHNVPLPLTAFMLVRMIFDYEQDYIKSEKSDKEFLQLLKHMLLKN